MTSPLRWLLLAVVVLAGAGLPGMARAAETFALPPGEASATWSSALELGDFACARQGEAPVVELAVVAGGGILRVRPPGGVVREVGVVLPRTAGEREDLVWLARSLLTEASDPALPALSAAVPAAVPDGAAPVGGTREGVEAVGVTAGGVKGARVAPAGAAPAGAAPAGAAPVEPRRSPRPARAAASTSATGPSVRDVAGAPVVPAGAETAGVAAGAEPAVMAAGADPAAGPVAAGPVEAKPTAARPVEAKPRAARPVAAGPDASGPVAAGPAVVAPLEAVLSEPLPADAGPPVLGASPEPAEATRAPARGADAGASGPAAVDGQSAPTGMVWVGGGATFQAGASTGGVVQLDGGLGWPSGLTAAVGGAAGTPARFLELDGERRSSRTDVRGLVGWAPRWTVAPEAALGLGVSWRRYSDRGELVQSAGVPFVAGGLGGSVRLLPLVRIRLAVAVTGDLRPTLVQVGDQGSPIDVTPVTTAVVLGFRVGQ